jgi:hypothetical protein
MRVLVVGGGSCVAASGCHCGRDEFAGSLRCRECLGWFRTKQIRGDLDVLQSTDRIVLGRP